VTSGGRPLAHRRSHRGPGGRSDWPAGHGHRDHRGRRYARLGRHEGRGAPERSGHHGRRPADEAHRGDARAEAWSHPTRQGAARVPRRIAGILRRLVAPTRHNSNTAYSLSPSAAPKHCAQAPRRRQSASRLPAQGLRAPPPDQRPTRRPRPAPQLKIPVIEPTSPTNNEIWLVGQLPYARRGPTRMTIPSLADLPNYCVRHA